MNAIRRYLKKATIPIIFVALLSILVVNTGFVRQNFVITKNLDIFIDLFGKLFYNYVDEFDPNELMRTGINAMLHSLDPYSEFIPDTNTDDIRFMTTGRFDGFGISVRQKDGYIIIYDVFEGFPADKAGLQHGDRILEIDGKGAKNLTPDNAQLMLKGEAGTDITLVVAREGVENNLIVKMEREVVKISNISYYGVIKDSKTGYLALEGFTEDAGMEVRNAVRYLKREHDIENLIIDLRDNAGGLISEAVNVINLFVERNREVLNTRGRIAERNMTYKTLNQPLDLDIPLAILVNGNSASASEVVAGVIQDFDRGVIIGQRTFGKGSVQRIIPLTYGSAVKVTVSRYYIPSGRGVQNADHSPEEAKSGTEATPDSLLATFTTINGRTVLGGGGIRPDITTQPKTQSNIAFALSNGFHIFEFANHFFRNNPSILPPHQFTITDQLYSDFVKFLDGRNYSFDSDTELLVDYLRSIADKENYLDEISDQIDTIEQRVAKSKKNDLFVHRDEISALLRQEIVNRYYKQRGRKISSLMDDPEIAKALEILRDRDMYNQLLMPKK